MGVSLQKKTDMTMHISVSNGEPCDAQIEAAAKAWMTWQFKKASWDSASPAMKDKFREGARLVLLAAAKAECDP